MHVNFAAILAIATALLAKTVVSATIPVPADKLEAAALTEVPSGPEFLCAVC
ncbi:hypothetical protein BV25DRAFT_1831755 [Artomyces pyxidatus]|uniref:Uncharacterized protein n=1 Tax=Artomyces pyxidatus TaxID=48021 RepID=A0ACB8SL55_9AGAM|nr:hypothetical protein BV25DRAFT_1831755 [Artomyces pyxidatus]